jgi:hypothetical protein
MKKNLLLTGLLLVTMASCEGPMGPQGEGMNWEVRNYVVRKSDWQLVGGQGSLNSYYMYEVNESLLSDFIYTDGNVFAYLIQNPGQNSEVQTPLPYVLPVGEWSGGQEFLWTEIFSFDFMPGSIAFYVSYSDFATDVALPEECEFRVVMNW